MSLQPSIFFKFVFILFFLFGELFPFFVKNIGVTMLAQMIKIMKKSYFFFCSQKQYIKNGHWSYKGEKWEFQANAMKVLRNRDICDFIFLPYICHQKTYYFENKKFFILVILAAEFEFFVNFEFFNWFFWKKNTCFAQMWGGGNKTSKTFNFRAEKVCFFAY